MNWVKTWMILSFVVLYNCRTNAQNIHNACISEPSFQKCGMSPGISFSNEATKFSGWIGNQFNYNIDIKYNNGYIDIYEKQENCEYELVDQLPVEFQGASISWVFKIGAFMASGEGTNVQFVPTVAGDGELTFAVNATFSPGGSCFDEEVREEFVAPIFIGGSSIYFIKQPIGRSSYTGDTVVFDVVAWSLSAIQYQWKYRSGPESQWENVGVGSGESRLVLTDVLQSQAGQYMVTASNADSSVNSQIVDLTLENSKAPTITRQPGGSSGVKIANLGKMAILSVEHDGAAFIGPPSYFNYQWFEKTDSSDWEPLTESGPEERQFIIPSISIEDHGRIFRVVVEGRVAPAAVSEEATLSVICDPIEIVQQPLGGIVEHGSDYTFTVEVERSVIDPVTYQWKKDGKEIEDATDSYLSIRGATLGNAGIYSVEIRRQCNQEVSSNAVLSVNCYEENCEPYLTYVEELKFPEYRGTYSIGFRNLLPPFSDAANVTVFKVVDVVSGSLVIDGGAFDANRNCTIGLDSQIVWIPPGEELISTVSTAFRVVACNDSGGPIACTDVPVEIHIARKQPLFLFGWGDNQFGQIGNGWLGSYEREILDSQVSEGYRLFEPEWEELNLFEFNDYTFPFESIPRRIEKIKDPLHAGCGFGNSFAVTKDGLLYSWGHGNAYLFGVSRGPFGIVGSNPNGFRTFKTEGVWTWGVPDITYDSEWIRVPLIDLLLPIPLRYSSPKMGGSSSPFVGNIAAAANPWGALFALKTDGSLWSWGMGGFAGAHGVMKGVLGRYLHNSDPNDPESPWEDYVSNDLHHFSVGSESIFYGMSAQRVLIEGNGYGEPVEGREVEEFHISNTAGIARCKDRSVWFWGNLHWIQYIEPILDFSLQPIRIVDDQPEEPLPIWLPQRVTCLDFDGTPSRRVKQLDLLGNQIVVLREDGKVFEMGYVPTMDSDGFWTAYRGYRAWGGGTDPDSYSTVPVPVDFGSAFSLEEKVVQVCSGGSFSAALTESGEVWIWGWLHDQGPDSPAPRQVPFPSGIQKIAVGLASVWAIDRRGSLWAWGYDAGWKVVLNGYGTQPAYYGLMPNAGQAYSTGGYLPNGWHSIPIRVQGIENVTEVFPSRDFDRIGVFAIASEEQGKPLNLTAVSGDERVQLEWSSYPSASQYRIYRSGDRDTGYVLIGAAVANTYLDSNPQSSLIPLPDDIENFATYFYRVSAVVNGIETEKSWEVEATPIPLQDAVVNLTVAGRCRGIKLTWEKHSDADTRKLKEYRVHRKQALENDYEWIASCVADAESYFDDGAVSGLSYEYKVIPVSTAGDGVSAVAGPVSIDTAGACPAAPVIPSGGQPGAETWRLNGWFTISSSGGERMATLYWGEPDGASAWTEQPSAFRVRYWYRRNGRDSVVVSRVIPCVPLEEHAPSVSLWGDDNEEIQCHQFSWPVLEGVPYYASVTAIIDGEESEVSTVVGPLTGIYGIGDFEVRAQGGYQQVYLDWPPRNGACSYDVMATSVKPGATPYDYNETLAEDWVTIASGLMEPRFWHTDETGLKSTRFSSVDIKSLPAIVARFKNPASGSVEAHIRGLLSQGTLDKIDNDQYSGLREAFVSDLNAAVSDSGLVFNPSGFGIFGADLSGRTHDLLEKSTLTSEEAAALNRLLLEDVFRDGLARFAEPGDKEFVSDDLVEVHNFIIDLVYPWSDLGNEIWTRMDQSVQTAILNFPGNPTANEMASMRRILAAELNRIIQEGDVLVTNSPYLASSRTVELFDRRDSLNESEITLLNRLLIEDVFYGRIQKLDAFKYYSVVAVSCDGGVYSTRSRWVAARPSDTAQPPDQIQVVANASAYSEMVNVDWRLFRVFENVTANSSLQIGSGPLTIFKVTRRNGELVLATGAENNDYTVDSASGEVTVLSDSNLITSSGETVVVEFVPGQSNGGWQFLLERKDGQNGEYFSLTEAGFGLAYLDKDVVNGQTYHYRVTAFDSDFNRYQSGPVSVVPAQSSFELLDPISGNNYVDLVWTPTRAGAYYVRHGSNANGPFENLTTLVSQSGFDNPPSTYRHLGAQNGVSHYYQIVAVTPEGSTELRTSIKSAIPSGNLPPLPPDQFDAEQFRRVADEQVTRRFLLKWSAQAGASKYQVFHRENGVLKKIYEGNQLRTFFELPSNIEQHPDWSWGVGFTFAVCSLNQDDVAGELKQETFRWTEVPGEGEVDGNLAIRLKIGDSFAPFDTFTGPTNLILSTDLSLPNVKRVTFYKDGELLGTAENGKSEFIWFNVPKGLHRLSAAVEITDIGAVTGTTKTIVATPSVDVEVDIRPELNAFRTASTDLELPGGGLSLSRFYNSRSVTKNDGDLAIGWTANWMLPSVKLSQPIGAGWKGAISDYLGVPLCVFSETEAHLLTVTLPSGSEIYYQVAIGEHPSTLPFSYADGVRVTLEPFAPYSGTLGGIQGDRMTIHSPDDVDTMLAEEWDGTTIEFSGTYGPFKYTDPSGVVYTFALPDDQSELRWLLTKIEDRNQNVISYSYQDSRLQSIEHSSGRKLTFVYNDSASYLSQSAKEIEVYDMIGSDPAVIYILNTADQLWAVKRLVTRSSTSQPGAVYETTTYVYGTTGGDTGRITEIYDTRGIRLLLNEFIGDDPGTIADEANGDLVAQTDAAGNKIIMGYDPETGQITVNQVDSEDEVLQSVRLDHDESGRILGTTQPRDGQTPNEASLQTRLIYDERGRVIEERNADGKSRRYVYDDQDRLIAQQDENGNAVFSSVLRDDGQPSITRDASGTPTYYVYDSFGNPLEIRSPGGSTTEYTYAEPASGLGRRTRWEIQDGSFIAYPIVTEYAYYGEDGADPGIKGDIKSVTQAELRITVAGNKLLERAITTYYEYDANGNRIADIRSRTKLDGTKEFIRTESTYDAKGRLVSSEIQTGNSAEGPWTAVDFTRTETKYNALGKQFESIDGYGRKTQYIYDLRGNLIETIYPDNSVSRTAYDSQGRPEYVQERSRAFASGSGAAQIWTTTAPATKTTYDPSGRAITTERLSSVTFVRSIAAPGTDFVTNPSYNGASDPQFKMTVSGGTLVNATRTFYDNVGRIKYTVDARNLVTRYDYDDAGRQKSVTVYPEYVYDPTPEQGATQSPEPSPSDSEPFVMTHYGYDVSGNQTSVTTAITQSDSIGQTTTFDYDEAGRRIRTTFPATDDAGLRSQSTYYDGLGRRRFETDEAGVTTAYHHNFRGLLESITLAFGTSQAQTATYEYDEAGNQVAQIDANGNVTRYAYDALGRRTHRFLPGAAALTDTLGTAHNDHLEKTVYAADQVDTGIYVLRREVTDFRGLTITNIFDRLDRLQLKLLPSVGSVPGTWVSYEYGPTGQRGRVSQGVSPSLIPDREEQYAYDGLNRLRVKETPEGTLSYEYDDSGLITRISAQHTYGDWKTNPPFRFSDLLEDEFNPQYADWNYQYDRLGRLIKVNADSTSPTSPADAAYTYTAAGNVETMAYRNGLITTYTYNDRNWLRNLETRKSGILKSSVDYDNESWEPSRRLSPVGLRRRVAESVAMTTSYGRTLDYDYDELRRLTREEIGGNGGPTGIIDYGNVSETYAGFDRVGNRQSRKVTGSALVSAGVTDISGDTFDENDRLNVGSSYTYDASGNTISDPTGATYVYDAENRLIRRTGGSSSTTVEFSYDQDGNRIRKHVENGSQTVTTTYLQENQNLTGYSQVIQEHESINGRSKELKVTYVYGPGLVSQKRGNGTYYYGRDGLGSVRYLSDENGTVTDAYAYDAYGIQIAAIGSTSNEHRFAGEYYDWDLGMSYNRARWYKPQIGRFWTMDTYEGAPDDPLSLHKYLYCHANPVNGIDPSGHNFIQSLGTLFIQTKLAAITFMATHGALAEAVAITTAFSIYQSTQLLVTGIDPETGQSATVAATAFAIVDVLPAGKFITKPLKGPAKDIYRNAARNIWDALSRVSRDGHHVHHRIPLEWAHIFPDLNPNRIANLKLVPEHIHNGQDGVTAAWRQFKETLGGRTPTKEEVLAKAVEIEQRFGQHFKSLE